MNVEKILALADLIEGLEHTTLRDDAGFCMSDYDRGCGTPACICGWINWTIDPKSSLNNHQAAAVYLGIDIIKANNLFFACGNILSDITPAQAAKTLRHLAETGDVVWALEDAT